MSTARDIGVISLLEVGCEVYSRERRHGGSDLPIGGVVVETVEHLDTETGELGRAFVVLDVHTQTLDEHRISLAEVDQETIQPASDSTMRKAIRRLCRLIALGDGAKRYQERSGPFSSLDARRIDHAHRLRGALMPK